MRSVPGSSGIGRGDFQRVLTSFLSQPGLPFASVLSAERIEQIFKRHGNLFGRGQVYTTVVMVWSFLGQVLRDGKEASCQAAVARIAAWNFQGMPLFNQRLNDRNHLAGDLLPLGMRSQGVID